MTRLPTPGGDNGAWGDILNEYLSKVHNSDGTLKDAVVGSSQLQDNAVSNAQIADGSVTTPSLADGAVTSAKLTSSITDSLAKADYSLQSSDVDTNATANKIAKRTATGAVKVADAANDDEAANLGQARDEITTARVLQDGSHVTSVRPLGADGSGSVADDAAFYQTQLAANSTTHDGLGYDPGGLETIKIPAGVYKITEIMGMLGRESKSGKTSGLRIEGAGSDLTTIVYEPGSNGPLLFNDYWTNIQFYGMTFRTTVSGVDWMHSYTTHNAQRYTFWDVAWLGPWRYVFDLQGDNNNSEYSFYACQSSWLHEDGAFLHVGSTNTTDQFLNYWFYGFKHWLTAAPIIDAEYGGHFHFYGTDVSAFAVDQTVDRPLFKLGGINHSMGVCTFTADGLRVEARSAKGQLLQSSWPHGTVSFRDTDWSSQAPFYTYGDIIKINYESTSGASYIFDGCHLAGGVSIKYSLGTWGFNHRIVFRDCLWCDDRLTPTEVVSYDETDAEPNTSKPAVHFERCRSLTYTNVYDEGRSVWDAVVGWQGELGVELPKKSYSIRSIYGAPQAISGGTLAVHLPLNALITGLHILAPAGSTSAAATGTWTLATTESTPTTIATVSSPGAISNGYDVTGTLSIPYLCSTREQASITITASGADQFARYGLMLIEGYW